MSREQAVLSQLDASAVRGVRPAAVTRRGALWSVSSARSTSAWIDGPFGWTCQPT